MAKHCIKLGHRIQFQNTIILTMRSGRMECNIREVTEIELQPNNMNREGSFSLSKLRKPHLQTVKEQKKTLFSKEK